MLADRDRAIRTVLKGLTGAVTVNGKKYESMMPPQEAVLTDAQISDVLTYSFNTWGNTGDAFSTAQVKALRNETH
jgi:mono/diheme cytochrome c family protein